MSYTSTAVIAPTIHHSLRFFSFSKGGKVISTVLAIPVALRNLHYFLELPVGNFSAAITTSLRTSTNLFLLTYHAVRMISSITSITKNKEVFVRRLLATTAACNLLIVILLSTRLPQLHRFPFLTVFL